MALLMTMLTVTAMLGGIALLLWFSAYIESRQLGPVTVVDATDSEASAATRPVLSMVEAPVQTAA